MFRLFSGTHIVHNTTNLLKPASSCTSPFLPTLFLISSISTTTANNTTSFTTSYLINSCGFSKEKAIAASKKLQFRTSITPDSVLALFRAHGFPTTHISTIIQKCPSCLVIKPKTLQPKLDFFRSLGLSGPELADLLAAVPFLLKSALNTQIIPAFDLLKTILGDDIDAVHTFKRSAVLLHQDPHKLLLPRIDILRSYSIPDTRIAALLKRQPRCFCLTIDRFKEIAETVKEMDFNPLGGQFIKAVKVLSGLSKQGWETKADAFRRWGWSDIEIQGAFRRDPNYMTLSEKKITCNMKFFVNQVGYDSKLIANYPVVLSYSMEKRIIPRWKVMQLLASKGLIKKDTYFITLLNLSEKRFLSKFVTKFEDSIPELLDLYQGKITCLEI